MKRNALFTSVYVPTFLLAFSQGITIPTLPLPVQTFEDSCSLISLALAALALAGVGFLSAATLTLLVKETLAPEPAAKAPA